MSKVEDVNFFYICDLAFETRKQFVVHKLKDEHSNRVGEEYDDEVEKETMRVYNSDQDKYFVAPKTKPKLNPKHKFKLITKPKLKTS